MKRLLFILVLVFASLAVAQGGPPPPNRAAIEAYQTGNYREAMRLFRPLAEQGNAEAQYYVGRMYERGQGVSKDEKQIRNWYRRSAEGGYSRAQYKLAVGYAFGLAGAARDEEEAVKWLKMSAEGGYTRAQKVLSRAYAEGRFGLDPDRERAEYWARRAEGQR